MNSGEQCNSDRKVRSSVCSELIMFSFFEVNSTFPSDRGASVIFALPDRKHTFLSCAEAAIFTVFEQECARFGREKDSPSSKTNKASTSHWQMDQASLPLRGKILIVHAGLDDLGDILYR